MLGSLFNKVVGLQACNFIKKRLRHRRLPVNIAKFLRTAFSMEHLRWLLLCVLEREEEESVEQRSKEKKSFNFYLQILVLAMTEMQIQLCKY